MFDVSDNYNYFITINNYFYYYYYIIVIMNIQNL